MWTWLSFAGGRWPGTLTSSMLPECDWSYLHERGQQMTTSMPTRAHELYMRARQSLAGGVSSSFRAAVKPEPLFVEYGQGTHLIDTNGVRYVDFALAWGPLILGHSHPAIISAVQAQLERG